MFKILLALFWQPHPYTTGFSILSFKSWLYTSTNLLWSLPLHLWPTQRLFLSFMAFWSRGICVSPMKKMQPNVRFSDTGAEDQSPISVQTSLSRARFPWSTWKDPHGASLCLKPTCAHREGKSNKVLGRLMWAVRAVFSTNSVATFVTSRHF